MTETPLFENRRYCEECHCLLPTSYEGTLCPRCLEQELFHQVKEYIQTTPPLMMLQHIFICRSAALKNGLMTG
jgi:predicted amidophosphoribosyltransferase